MDDAPSATAGISSHWALRQFLRETAVNEEMRRVRSEEVPGLPGELLEQASDPHTYGDPDWE